jgi:hypothetical protein
MKKKKKMDIRYDISMRMRAAYYDNDLVKYIVGTGVSASDVTEAIPEPFYCYTTQKEISQNEDKWRQRDLSRYMLISPDKFAEMLSNIVESFEEAGCEEVKLKGFLLSAEGYRLETDDEYQKRLNRNSKRNKAKEDTK